MSETYQVSGVIQSVVVHHKPCAIVRVDSRYHAATINCNANYGYKSSIYQHKRGARSVSVDCHAADADVRQLAIIHGERPVDAVPISDNIDRRIHAVYALEHERAVLIGAQADRHVARQKSPVQRIERFLQAARIDRASRRLDHVRAVERLKRRRARRYAVLVDVHIALGAGYVDVEIRRADLGVLSVHEYIRAHANIAKLIRIRRPVRRLVAAL